MNILALESAAAVGSAALLRDGRRIAELTLETGNTHSETLLPSVDMLLKLTGLSLKDVDLFAASVGPGSFTGIRIGAATVKGLAFGTDKPCIGVSSVEALAYGLLGTEGLVCPVLNARRRQVYTAIFRASHGKLERLTADTLLTVDELDGLLAAYPEAVSFVGDAWQLAEATVTHAYRPVAAALRGASAVSVALAALAAYENGARGSDATLTPIYLRPCQAERERLEKLNAKENGST